MHIKRHMQFNAPDTGAAIAVPASSSPTGQSIEVTPPTPQPAPEIIQPPAIDRGISAPGPKIKPADVAKELGMSESPSRAIERAAKATRDKLTGRFTPERKTRHKPEAKQPTAKPALGEPEPKAAAQVAPPVGEPEPKAEEPKAEEPKIKIGDQEKTAAEWEAYHQELAKKAEASAPKPEQPAPGAGKPEAAAPDDTERREKWMEEAAAHFAPTQEEFDRMLADGDVKAFGRMMARVAEDTRRWMAEQVGSRLEQFEGQLQPIVGQQQQIAQYQTEHQFLESNPTIKGHPDGLKTMREMAAMLRAEHDDLLETIAAVPTSALNGQRQERAKLLETAFLSELAKATTAKLGLNGSAPAAPTAPAAPARAAAPAAPKPRPVPQTGVVGNGSAGVIKGASSEIAQMRAHGLM